MFRSENYTSFQLDNETISQRRQLLNKFKCQGKAEYTGYRKAYSVHIWSELQILLQELFCSFQKTIVYRKLFVKAFAIY